MNNDLLFASIAAGVAVVTIGAIAIFTKTPPEVVAMRAHNKLVAAQLDLDKAAIRFDTTSDGSFLAVCNNLMLVRATKAYVDAYAAAEKAGVDLSDFRRITIAGYFPAEGLEAASSAV